MTIRSRLMAAVRKLFFAEPYSTPPAITPAVQPQAESEVTVSELQIDIYAEHAKWMELAARHRFDEAIDLCLATIASPNTNFVASLFLGHAYAQTGRMVDAQTHLRAAAVLNPDDYYANLLLANAESALGRRDEAIVHYMRCCMLQVESIVEPFEAAMKLAQGHPDNENGVALSALFDHLLVNGKLPELLGLKFLFFWRRDTDLMHRLAQGESDDAGEAKPSFRHVYSVEAWARDNGQSYVRLGEPTSIRLVAPTEVYADHPQEKHVLASEPYVAEIRDAIVVGNSSLVYVGDGSILSDVVAHPQYGNQVSLEYDKTVLAQRPDALLLAPLAVPGYLKEGIMLSGLASNAYGHWFAEFLPKLRHFEKHPHFHGLPIIVDAGMPPSHFDFLAALVSNPLHRLESGATLAVGCLHLAPTTTFFPVELFRDHTVPPEHQASWTAESMRYIREGVLRNHAPSPRRARRLFLSRKNSSWRILRNEGEIIAGLQDLGFETVFLEDYDFARQVQTFGEAEFIVAPNGSALNSLIFAATDVKALVLGQQNSFNWGGWLGPILDLGFKPEFMEGEATESTAFKHSDYVVPAERVRAKVLAMLAS
jgi:tetratricopeptide (TPR) repeat protein